MPWNCFWSCLILREEEIRPRGQEVGTEAWQQVCDWEATMEKLLGLLAPSPTYPKPSLQVQEKAWQSHLSVTQSCVLHRMTKKKKNAHFIIHLPAPRKSLKSFRTYLWSQIFTRQSPTTLSSSFFFYGGNSFNPNNMSSWSAHKCFSKEIFLDFFSIYFLVVNAWG